MNMPEGYLPSPEVLAQQMEQLAITAFEGVGIDLSGQILGMSDDVVIAPSILDFVMQPDTTVASVAEAGRVVGFSAAIPIGRMDPSREAESSETAYIYITAVEPGRQGEGVVGEVMEDLLRQLKGKGFGFVERDCLTSNGYADNVQKTYQGSIVAMNDHTRWEEIGPERFFRIDLSRVTI